MYLLTYLLLFVLLVLVLVLVVLLLFLLQGCICLRATETEMWLAKDFTFVRQQNYY